MKWRVVANDKEGQKLLNHQTHPPLEGLWEGIKTVNHAKGAERYILRSGCVPTAPNTRGTKARIRKWGWERQVKGYMVKIDYWLKHYIKLRSEGAYPLADQLKEMLRRMGWEIQYTKDDIIARKTLEL